MNHSNNARLYTDYYNTQTGAALPFFAGHNRQSGYGVGHVLKGLFNAVVPLISSVGKTLGKRALRTGINIASDVVQGQNVKESVKKRTREAGRSLINNAVDRFNPRSELNIPIKRRHKRKKISRKKIRSRFTSARDIFNN